jgi:hypothetical protein
MWRQVASLLAFSAKRCFVRHISDLNVKKLHKLAKVALLYEG